MWGVGDVIHERAVVRELMQRHSQVWLQTHNVAPLHDLIEDGLRIVQVPHPRIRERTTIPPQGQPPSNIDRRTINYHKAEIDVAGTILAAQFMCAGLPLPEWPDFSMPIRPDWNAEVEHWLKGVTRPIMIYRPIVLNRFWHRPNRSPDPEAYAALYASIRAQFFVISVGHIADGAEWIVGPEPEVDLHLDRGELAFEDLAALTARADLCFCNPGFMPVLSQAVGCPTIVVYGGNESSRTTNAAGAHMAPSLFIDVDRPCDCHDYHHACDKTITLPPALERVRAFCAP